MTKPIQIKNEDVVRDIRELATLKGTAITEAVATAVRGELLKARRAATPAAQRERKIDEILARVRALPRTGRTLTDADIYDEDGLPR